MGTLLLRLGLLSLVIASSGSAVTMAWTPIGNPGNSCDPMLQGCFGAVPYSYNIGTYEVTNAQYTEFLNAVASEGDTTGIYSPSMSITQTVVSPDGYGYSAVAGRESMPVTFVSFYPALRFVNWLYNGQPTGKQDSTTTEDGAYTLLGGLPDMDVTRNAGATIVLPSRDEWYKAAYYDAVAM